MFADGPDAGGRTASLAGGRTFHCVECRFAITLLEGDETPECPRCGGDIFRPSSMFHEDTSQVGGPRPEAEPAWLEDIRRTVARQGPHLAFDDGEELRVVPLPEGFTRVGRSFQADIHLASPTVSRRHALIHREGDTVTVLDDHSLNGVFVDGEAVDFQPLEDGNELELGGFHLHYIATA
jgi:predicted RNA-binding Zn-ribbon protein involved in translation (DUF1610 family)